MNTLDRGPRIGLLPLYLKLYDETLPDTRQAFAGLTESVTNGFADQGIDVVQAGICRLADEFDAAVAGFTAEDVDCIVTLHLAYSPSLESIDALVKTPLPILVLDTTMDHSFGRDVSPEGIMYNHGIHGVMDMACMLRRRGRPFQIVAGHVTESDVLGRAGAIVRAAFAARRLRQTRALRIGEAFAGMGDFAVDEAVLKDKLGITVTTNGPGALAAEG